MKNLNKLTTPLVLLLLTILSTTTFARGTFRQYIEECPVPYPTDTDWVIGYYSNDDWYNDDNDYPSNGATITSIDVNCPVSGDFPKTRLIVDYDNSYITINSERNTVYDFNGLPADSFFDLWMKYDYSDEEGTSAGECTIDISWKRAAPENVIIAGDSARGFSVPVNENINISAYIDYDDYGYFYNWQTLDSSICSVTKSETYGNAIVTGKNTGSCAVEVEVCNENDYGADCIYTTEIISVTAAHLNNSTEISVGNSSSVEVTKRVLADGYVQNANPRYYEWSITSGQNNCQLEGDLSSSSVWVKGLKAHTACVIKRVAHNNDWTDSTETSATVYVLGAAPVNADITTTNSSFDVLVKDSINLNGTVTNGTDYSWWISDEGTEFCTITAYKNDNKEITLKGDKIGLCKINRKACNSDNACTYSARTIHVKKRPVPVGAIFLLLSK